MILRVRTLLVEERLQLLLRDFSLNLLRSLPVLKIVDSILYLWAESFTGLFVMPEDVALEGHTDAAHAEPYAHVEEIVRLGADDSAN